ncbi:hypothetical protein JX265_005390 [Neoarthrinium moseri]|uniref:DH domain-containing protein n=1 Tax=Neoarthrinium moseri TaxID=1658444 RepID=A0A9Q0AR94_9PEZI|nr:hypothetical protein JX265_005390 [Neoarthrinium moseri]
MEAGNRDHEDRLAGLLQSQSPTRRPLPQLDILHSPYHLPYSDPSGPGSSSRGDAEPLECLPYEHTDSHSGAGQVPLQLHSAALASYAANNRQAANANANGLVDPGDFYRTYRAVINASAENPTTTSDYGELMASTSTLSPAQRQNPNASSLRSNSNGTTPKHPAVASAARTGLRTTPRSVSAPIHPQSDAKGGAATSGPAAYGSRQPSVKDLKKRFDHNATAQAGNGSAAMAARKTTPRMSARETSSAASPTPANYRGVGSANASSSPYSASRTSSGARTPSATRSTQRSRFSAEDQVSNNSQSFASRIAKPRTGHGLSSKSMSNLSPTSPVGASSVPPLPRMEKSSVDSPGKSLLFGEILPGENDAGLAGFGIDSARPRRTSESNLRNPAGLHHRSLSHADAEPASPTDWYRSAHAPGESSKSPTKPHKSHNRSRSDLAGSKPTPTQLRTPLSSRKQATPTPDLGPSPATSRLPVSVRKNSPSSSSASPPFSRSNSPSTAKRPPTRTQGRIHKPPPISTSSARARTPTSGPTGKRPPGTITPNGNTRLNAYISAPPPKLSPPLRSSRPRQPVSSATTASSRMKAVERGRSPAKHDSRTGKPETQRRRKISMGPIDFDARREQIKLSYTKSIRETEAKAAARRRAAAEKERQRREEEAIAAQAALAAAENQRQDEEGIEQHGANSDIDADAPESEMHQHEEHEQPEQPALTLNTGISLDSPTLGMPGSFPPLGSPDMHDEAPPSAVSDTTEFDAEPQTEPPSQQTQQAVVLGYDGPAAEAQPVDATTTTPAEYKSPFDESPVDGNATIPISLEVLPPQVQEPTLDSGRESLIPGPDQDEYTPQPYAAPSYETTVTIIGRNADFTSTPEGMDQVSSSCDAESAEVDPQQEPANETRAPSPSPNTSGGREASSGDECSDHDAGLRKLEEFYIGPNVAESAARLRESTSKAPPRHARTWSMEQNEQAPQEPRFSTETRRTIETRPSLNVPRASYSANRASHNTVWTDYSVESREDFPDFSVKLQRRDSAYRENDSVSEAGSRIHSSRHDRNSRTYPSSPESSPHGSYRSPRVTGESQLRSAAHQLPELDTGGGFVVDYITRKNSTAFAVPVLPDHSPPPPPEEAAFPDLSSAPPSEYFNDTRPSSYLHGTQDGHSTFSVSRPQSESFDLPGSTPHSVDQASLDISEGHTSTRTRMDSQTTLADSIDQDNSAGLSAKERKRLFTRLETVKELIDTEAFFIRDMNIVEEIYKGTAEACPQLDDNTIKLIFRNTDQIITFHTAFLAELKEGVSSVYVPKVHRSMIPKDASSVSDGTLRSVPAVGHLDDGKDRETSLGPIFKRNMDKMKAVHETFLKNSDHAAKRLIQIQEDPTVKVWLNECNEVARDLTKAWNLDSLLIKPMQRITKYPNLLVQLLHETPADHPDRPALESAKSALEDAIEEINKTKKNFELVGQIVGRKRKDSDVRGFARAFGKRVDKLQATNNRPSEDAEYAKLHEKFGDDYLRLQVVLRDVEFYTRQVTAYVHEFLQYLSSMELVMRLQPSPHPELESKWVRFNVSMRDIEKVALEQHLSQVRKHVIEPFEHVIKAYSNPSLAMKKRAKRRVDYEKSVQLKKAGKKLDKQLTECVEQYDALNEALKKELPKLSALTEKIGNICLGNFVNIQTQWFSIWKEKVKVVLDNQQIPEIPDIISNFQRDYSFQEEQMQSISILNPTSTPRVSQSTSIDDSQRLRPRPSELSSLRRGRGLSVNSDVAPSLPTPDFVKRNSGQFTVSPSVNSVPSPHQFYYRDYYAGINSTTPAGSGTPNTPEASGRAPASGSLRPGTGQSYDSGGMPRRSTDSGQTRRYSNSVYPTSGYQSPPEPSQNQRYSGLFHSALPLSDAPEKSVRQSRASSRASSRERPPIDGYNVLWLAASLFEFNIETTKHEAGYPYLTYQAGEIFDVIAEKGELWLAKNQDDPKNLVGWLWSKHFAKLADD